MFSRRVLLLSVLALPCCPPRLWGATPEEAQEKLFWHAVRLDRQGELLSWYTGDSPYGQVVVRGWDAFKKVPVQPNGYKTYVTYPVFFGADGAHRALFAGRDWTHNPASLFAMLTDGALLYYAYSGDAEIMPQIGAVLDHHMARGSTERTDAWAGVPYASADGGDPNYRGASDSRYRQKDGMLGRGDGRGVIEPDKVGELGLAYLRFYQFRGEPRYLDAATRCADALARHIRPGTESRSPWPFRVDARTGRHIREDYTANTIGPIRLLDEMIRLGRGDVAAYRTARDAAWQWLMTYPMRNNVWAQYFEDIYIYPDYRTNVSQYSALETARYLLEHPTRDSKWREHARSILGWVRRRFAADSRTMAGLPERGVQWGAEVISEQVNDMDKMTSHTARYASVLALYYERTGDCDARRRAFRSFNWASYGCREDGLVKTSLDEGTGYWFSDGYGDYMRHFSRGMASVPEWAPAGEDHLLRSTSVVRRIEYGRDRIAYTTFDTAAEELFKLRRPPPQIRCGETVLAQRPADAGLDRPACYTVAPVAGGGWAVRIRHEGTEVSLRLE